MIKLIKFKVFGNQKKAKFYFGIVENNKLVLEFHTNNENEFNQICTDYESLLTIINNFK